MSVIKRGGRAEVDFSGTSRQARSAINATPLDAKSTVGAAFKYLFNPHSPFTSGTWRNIDIVMPEGTIISALPPDGPVFLYYEQSQVMLGAMLRALAQAVGAAAMAATAAAPTSTTRAACTRRTPWVSAAQCGGEAGPVRRDRHGDAESQMYSYQSNGIGDRGRVDRADVPVVMLRQEAAPDTAGAGYHRGGCAVSARFAVAASRPSTT